MKLKKVFDCFAATIFFAIPVFAQLPAVSTTPSNTANWTLPFRAGTIVSAEISTIKPNFSEESPYDRAMFDNPCWVEIVVRLSNGRTISRFDYTLTGASGPYTCIAVAEGNTPYSTNQNTWIFKKPSPVKYYRMLFPVNANELNILGTPFDTKLATMTLKLNYFNSELPPISLKIRAMGDKNFSSISRIPAQGLYGISERQISEQK